MKKILFIAMLAFAAQSPTLYAHESEVAATCDAESTLPASMESEQRNASVVSLYLHSLFRTRDMAAISNIVAKNAVYSQAPGLPYGGTYVGFDEWLKMFTKSLGYFSSVQLLDEPRMYVSPGSKSIIANFSVKFQSKKSNKEITLPIAEQFELCDGKIAAIRPFYFDTKAIVDLVE